MANNLLSKDVLDALSALTEEFRTRIPEVLVSNNEAARLIGVSPNTICVYVKQKRLSKTTIGNVTGILLRDIVCFSKK